MWGGMGGDSNRPYSLTFSVNARNVFNNVNLANPVSVLSIVSPPGQQPLAISPSFDTSLSTAGGGFGGSSAANRTLYLQASFSF